MGARQDSEDRDADDEEAEARAIRNDMLACTQRQTVALESIATSLKSLASRSPLPAGVNDALLAFREGALVTIRAGASLGQRGMDSVYSLGTVASTPMKGKVGRVVDDDGEAFVEVVLDEPIAINRQSYDEITARLAEVETRRR